MIQTTKESHLNGIKPYIIQSNKHHIGHEDQKYVIFLLTITLKSSEMHVQTNTIIMINVTTQFLEFPLV